MADRQCAHASTHTQDTFNRKPAEPQIVTEWALYFMDPEFGAGCWNDGEFNLFEKQVLGVKGNFFLDAMHGKEAVPLVLPDRQSL